MSRRSRRGRRRQSHATNGSAPRRLPKSSFREYLERCEAVGREPVDFVTYLHRARRWRGEYGAAKERADLGLMRELEDLLCV